MCAHTHTLKNYKYILHGKFLGLIRVSKIFVGFMVKSSDTEGTRTHFQNFFYTFVIFHNSLIQNLC